MLNVNFLTLSMQIKFTKNLKAIKMFAGKCTNIIKFNEILMIKKK